MSLPVAGWYPDPYRQAQFRFWDGTQWTAYAAGPPVAYQYAPVPQPLGPQGTYGYAPVLPPPRSVWRRLDERMAEMRSESAVPWGIRPILIPTLAFVAVIAAGALVAALWNPTGSVRVLAGVLLSVTGYAVIGAAIWYVGRPIARRHGGWAATFGWSRPTAGDALPVVPWFLASIAARLIAAGIVVRIVPAWQHASAANVNLHGRPAGQIIGILIVAVIVAPPIEELMFRGVILRTLMRRYSFWPAAIASSLMFGLFHTYELDTLGGAALLGVSTAVFGLCQCLLVRRHVRLNAAIGVHSLANLVAALLTLVFLIHS